MSNPLFKMLSGTNANKNGPMQMIQEFMRFKNSFRGDPKAEIDKLIRSGAISQKDLNELQQMAQQFKSMLSGN